jgi:hypothetical protein
MKVESGDYRDFGPKDISELVKHIAIGIGTLGCDHGSVQRKQQRINSVLPAALDNPVDDPIKCGILDRPCWSRPCHHGRDSFESEAVRPFEEAADFVVCTLPHPAQIGAFGEASFLKVSKRRELAGEGVRLVHYSANSHAHGDRSIG